MIAAISSQGLGQRYGENWAVRGLSFDLSPGSVTAFLGPNGAGKSTSIKMILGLKRPTEGQATIFGFDPLSLQARIRLGYTPQELNYPGHLKVKELLSLIQAHHSGSLEFTELEREFSLAPVMNRSLGGLSGGERRRVGLAAALIGRPQILILDEPSTGLDVDAREWLWSLLKRFQSRGGSILLCTHDLFEAGKLADQVLLIDRGELIFSGTIQEIMAKVDLVKVSFVTNSGTEEHLVRDADSFVRELVSRGRQFSGLRVQGSSLEEAFRTVRLKGARG